MKTRLNVAVVGCGIGAEHVRDGFALHPDLFRIAALCDLDAGRLERLGAEFGVTRLTSDFDDLLAMPDIDVIDICTPPSLHLAQVCAALAAGKHVICEKPVVGSLAELDILRTAAESAPGLLMPIFQYRFGNGVAKAKAIIDAGIAGRPHVATAETFWRREAGYYATDWRGKWSTELGGVLMTQSIHIHDMLTCLMGPARRLFGRVATRVNPIEVEDCASATLEMESGALVSLTATLGSQDQISRLRMMFQNVTIESSHDPYAPGNDPWTFIPRDDRVAARIDALLKDWQPVPPRFAGQFAAFHRSATEGAALPVTLEDARRALELVTGFYHSAATGTEAEFPIGPSHPAWAGWRDLMQNRASAA